MKVRDILFGLGLFATGVFAGALATGTLNAQTAGFKRDLLLTAQIAASDKYAATVGSAVVPVGGVTPLHTHPGDEIGVLIEGEAIIESEGKEPRRVHAGQGFHIEATKKHLARSVGAVPARIVAIWIVEKGKPLSTTVK